MQREQQERVAVGSRLAVVPAPHDVGGEQCVDPGDLVRGRVRARVRVRDRVRARVRLRVRLRVRVGSTEHTPWNT